MFVKSSKVSIFSSCTALENTRRSPHFASLCKKILRHGASYKSFVMFSLVCNIKMRSVRYVHSPSVFSSWKNTHASIFSSHHERALCALGIIIPLAGILMMIFSRAQQPPSPPPESENENPQRVPTIYFPTTSLPKTKDFCPFSHTRQRNPWRVLRANKGLFFLMPHSLFYGVHTYYSPPHA